MSGCSARVECEYQSKSVRRIIVEIELCLFVLSVLSLLRAFAASLHFLHQPTSPKTTDGPAAFL